MQALPNYALLWPELLVTALALLVLALDFLVPKLRKRALGYLSAAGLAAVLALSLAFLWGRQESLYEGLFLVDNFSLFFKALFLIVGTFVILMSVDYVDQHLEHPGEFYGIILFSVVGMMVMAATGELLTAYIALELLSFSLYVLVAIARDNPKSNEAGLKYVLLGAFSTALLLYGISLLYGVLGVTRFEDISSKLQAMDSINPTLLVGLTLIIAGLGFKVAAVPFHMWAPDIYEGAPTPVTAYLSVASKAAAFALVLRFFAVALAPAVDQWAFLLVVLAAVTMTVGNLVAIAQRNIKRLIAYSSIAHVGYLLMGVAALSALGSNGLLFHLVGYAVTNLAAFVVIIAFFNRTGKEEISDFAGLADRAPFLAMALSAALFSLAGLPFFAGFTTKFYLFTAVAREGYLWLVGIAMVNSLISLYYYLMVIRQMYIEPASDASRLRVPALLSGLLAVLVLLIILIGIYPSPLLRAIEAATRAIIPA